MPTKKKRTETTSETITLVVSKKPANSPLKGWCEQCAAEVFWILSAEIELFGIIDLPQSNAIHKNGARLCSRTLIKEIKGQKL